MDDGAGEAGWSYWVLKLLNPEINSLEDTLNRAGADGWELVTSVSTNKVIGAFGNHLVFVLKKRGTGHQARLRPPTVPPTDPGWYTTPSGDERWWNGERWTTP